MSKRVCGKQACTFTPSVKCSDGREAGVGKIYHRAAEAETEARANTLVARIDRSHAFTVRSLGTCVTRDGRTQLLMDHAGATLEAVVEAIRGSASSQRGRERAAAKTYAGLVTLFRNLGALCDAGYAHHDISPQNVMTTDGVRYVMIDLGNLVKLEDVFTPRNRFLSATYPFNPPEYKLFAGSSDVARNYDADWLDVTGLDEAVQHGPSVWTPAATKAAAKTTDVFAFGVLMQWVAKTLRDAAPTASEKFARAGRIMAAMDFRARPSFRFRFCFRGRSTTPASRT